MRSKPDETPVFGEQLPRISHVPEYTRSAGPEALELCEKVGLTLDPWQAWCLEQSLGEREDGNWAASSASVVAPRQNGKSELLTARLVVGLFLLGEREIIYSSHRYDACMVVFRRLVAVIEGSALLRKRIGPVKHAHGLELVETTDGARAGFKTRTKLGGRGHSCDLLILDEAHILSEAAHGSLIPMLAARRRAQTWYAATPPDANSNEDSLVLSGVRERAIEGEDAERLFYAEWSVDAASPEDVTSEMARDPALWAQANPAFGTRISESQIESERQAMDPVSFAVERLGVGRWAKADGLPGAIDLENWKACEDPAPDARDRDVVFGFDIAPDRRSAAIAAAWLGDDGLPRLDVIQTFPQGDGAGPLAGLTERLRDLTSNHHERVMADSAPAGPLLDELQRLGVHCDLIPSAGELARACATFLDHVEARSLRYRWTEPLDLAVQNAATRPLGDSGFAWSRKSSAVDISPLVAATVALFGLLEFGVGERGPLMELIGDEPEVDPNWGEPGERGRR
jgi:phage terminase large subunit-like protein